MHAEEIIQSDVPGTDQCSSAYTAMQPVSVNVQGKYGLNQFAANRER